MRIIAILLMIFSLSACNPSGNRAAYSKVPFDPHMDDGTTLRPPAEKEDSMSLLMEATKDTSVKLATDTSAHRP